MNTMLAVTGLPGRLSKVVFDTKTDSL